MTESKAGFEPPAPTPQPGVESGDNLYDWTEATATAEAAKANYELWQQEKARREAAEQRAEKLQAKLTEQAKAQQSYAEAIDADVRAYFAHHNFEVPQVDGPIWQAMRRLCEDVRLRAEMAEAENANLVERLKAASAGQPLGPVIGAQAIVEQEIELKKLRQQLADVTAANQRLEAEAAAMRRAIEDINVVSAAHHHDQPAHILLHSLTLDIPARCEAALATPGEPTP